MRIEFNSLYWNNVDEEMLHAHNRVMEHFRIPMNYHNKHGVNHGQWMDWVCKNSDSDVIVFFEPDCIPLNDNFVEYIRYANKHTSFVGIAQVSNHIPPKSHIYAAPGFFCISKKAFDILGQPSFTETYRSDTGEELCYVAEERGLRYRALMPNYFEREPQEGLWPLSNVGYYGIGTVFDNTVYHLYQSRMAQNIDLFVQRCNEVVENKFSTDTFTPSNTFNYQGRIVR